jgi:hypothetical protein
MTHVGAVGDMTHVGAVGDMTHVGAVGDMTHVSYIMSHDSCLMTHVSYAHDCTALQADAPTSDWRHVTHVS